MLLLCSSSHSRCAAVDNILLGLQAEQFEDFARAGSLRRIAKPILKHVLHYSEVRSSSLRFVDA